ncbi:thioesterase [Nordella sp. HKS 07]|uniref:thioesterase family protein n=1 Tax=Nordella sp. HKS 07 TaxID=2712222 RepID=UPI0013E135CB|nr:thioesterase family protein [Nordella sp. HKS 07]QIG51914.1 thioesterase [Nordella sp. HKS 07]
MAFPAPFVSSAHKIEPEWTDYNGHFNMAYYNVLFDRAGDEVFDAIGLGAAYVKRASCSFFTLEAHVTYLRELHAGDSVTVDVQFLDYDAKRIHYFEQMRHAGEGFIAATSELIIIHVDMTTRRSAPFPPDVLANIKAMREAHAALPLPPQIGHRIGIPRK